MTPSIEIKLSGTLGERHRRLNASVRDTHQRNTSFSSVQNYPEVFPTDRLFKIDLATKQRNVDYIIHTLKDDDMLYVCRALKSLWLLEPEHSDIINPSFLEREVFTHMTLQASNKMRHWIQMHLRDPQRCEEFYQFYKHRDFDIAAKFLWHSSNEFILSEVIGILDKITPKLLKVLSEKVPQVTKIYYDNLRENQALLKFYLKNDFEFFANVKHLLKPCPDGFFHVLENYFVTGKFSSFNSAITQHILKHHKSRFMEKPELYTVWFLNVNALAKCLSSEEVKELVVKLAKAEYLGSWFSYKTVEPLIKRLGEEERTAFKKSVFVDKLFGPTVKEWPYPIPAPPVLIVPQNSLFEDAPIEEYPFNRFLMRSAADGSKRMFCCNLKRRKYAKWVPENTLLDQLFQQYRFSNYKKTQLELRKRLKAESSAQNRQYMLLVLVSKTGGRSEDLASLLDLLSQYKNEPVHIRAAIVRSLVKRAFVWRLAPEYWAKLLEWGHGLGLDGSAPDAACREGLHAVVARDLITGVTPQDPVWKAFLESFSSLTEYSFTVKERGCLRARLPTSLLAAAQSNPDNALNRLHLLLDTLAAYHIRLDDFPGALEAIAAAADRDFESAERLLRRVYKAGIARKRLIRQNFEMVQTDASYLNALRHDVSILDNMEKFEDLIAKKELNHDKFLRKLALYFTEKDGLGDRYRAVLELRAATAPDITLARPLTLLTGSSFLSLLKDFDGAPPKTPQRKLAAALRSNAHVVRPAFDLDSFGWRAAGAKAVATRVTTCRSKDVERYLAETLSWNRTLRLALILAKRVDKERDAYEVFASKRPSAALISALRYIRLEGDNSDLRIWDIVKTHISELHKDQLRRVTRFVPAITSDSSNRFLAEYWVLIYKACKKDLPEMRSLIISQIASVLAEVEDQYIFEEIDDFFNKYSMDRARCTLLRIISDDYDNINKVFLYIGIITRFLLLNTSEEMLEKRLEKVRMAFFKFLECAWKQAPREDFSMGEFFFDSLLLHLKYNKVYFDVKYTSCLPVFEKLTEWMHSFLPIDRWFGKYVTVHLTMIYFKTVRLCLKQNPELFSDESKKLTEAPHMLGTIFGKFVSNEIDELTQKYFPSITELYGAEVVNYFKKYFYGSHYDESVQKFTTAVVSGLLTDKCVASRVLAKYIFIGLKDRLRSNQCDDILNSFKESEIKELRFELDEIMNDSV